MTEPQRTWKIRQASPADLETVATLTEAAYRHWTNILGYEPVPVTEDYMPRIEAGEVFLLLTSGVPCGVLVLETHASYLEIFSIAIAPDYQGQGSGSYLLGWTESRAQEFGLTEVRLYTNALMETNIEFYLRRGYEVTARRPNPFRPIGEAVDMKKRLDIAGAKSE